MRFRKRFKTFKRPSFRSARRYGRRAFSSVRRRFKRRRRSGGSRRSSKLFGMQPLQLLLIAVASYMFIKPVHDFINKIFKKK